MRVHLIFSQPPSWAVPMLQALGAVPRQPAPEAATVAATLSAPDGAVMIPPAGERPQPCTDDALTEAVARLLDRYELPIITAEIQTQCYARFLTPREEGGWQR